MSAYLANRNGAAGAARHLRHDEPQVQPASSSASSRTICSQHGVVSQLVPTADGEKASLFATIGPAARAGIALSGHTDVVPVDGQRWTSDPFIVIERDGKLYGRGTSDMKGYLACVLAAVPDYRERQLDVPIHLAFSYDEEVGCTGVRPMIAEFGSRLVKPRMVFVGEPTSMTVVDCHKGPVRWHVEIKGRAAHSSMAPLGVNAIAVAGRLLGELSRHRAGAEGCARRIRASIRPMPPCR